MKFLPDAQVDLDDKEEDQNGQDGLPGRQQDQPLEKHHLRLRFRWCFLVRFFLDSQMLENRVFGYRNIDKNQDISRILRGVLHLISRKMRK